MRWWNLLHPSVQGRPEPSRRLKALEPRNCSPGPGYYKQSIWCHYMSMEQQPCRLLLARAAAGFHGAAALNFQEMTAKMNT